MSTIASGCRPGTYVTSAAPIICRADGLAWPTRTPTPGGPAEVYRTVDRGFNVIVWRTPELGYALVSDVDARELNALAARIPPR